MEGVEPTHPYGYQILSLARLPIPPHRLPVNQYVMTPATHFATVPPRETRSSSTQYWRKFKFTLIQIHQGSRQSQAGRANNALRKGAARGVLRAPKPVEAVGEVQQPFLVSIVPVRCAAGWGVAPRELYSTRASSLSGPG